MNPNKVTKSALNIPKELVSTSLLDPTKTSKEVEALRKDLEKNIIGQTEGIEAVLNIYQAYLSGMNPPGRPIGNFLFLGPTGTGKTRLVEAVSESLLKSPKAVVKIDCAEFQHSHEIAKLIGSPPGYLGHRETHPMLSQEVLNAHFLEKVQISFVLFDEIEKASDALWNLLLGIMDKATLTLGDNRKVDFSKAFIFMTSNLGSDKVGSLLVEKYGFNDGKISIPGDLSDKLIKVSSTEIKKKFSPEFVNRLDQVVTFQPLGKQALIDILELEISNIKQRIITNVNSAFMIYCTDSVKEYLIREGTDIKYGARHLKRALETNIVKPLANLVGSGQVKIHDIVRIDYSKQNGVTFELCKYN